jgi:hypothetical protein
LEKIWKRALQYFFKLANIFAIVFFIIFAFFMVALVVLLIWVLLSADRVSVSVPTDLKIDRIEKIMHLLPSPTSVPESNILACQQFQMSIEEFQRYFKNAKPIFDPEGHYADQFKFPCYYESKVNGKKYQVWLGGIGEVWEDSRWQYYASREAIKRIKQSRQSPD